MNIYSFISIRKMFVKKANELNFNKITRDNIRTSLFEFFTIKNLLNSKLFDKIYVAYSSEFYIDENGLNTINCLLMEQYSLSIELEPENVEHFVISNYENMQSVIEQIKLQLENPEHQNKKNIKKEEKKEENKTRIAFDRSFNNPLPKNINNKKLMALDFEYDQNKDFIIFECGITTLNHGKTEYKHYLVEEHYKNKSNIKYENQFKFNFGKSEIVSLSELLSIVQKEIDNCDYIIGHNIKSEYYVLSHHGINFLEKSILSIDSQRFFYCNFKYKLDHQNASLTTLLELLDISCENLHNSGNDAAYTMKAIVKMHDMIHGKSRIQNISYSPKRAKRFKHA